MDKCSMTLKAYMISGLKYKKVNSGWNIYVALRCGGNILFEYKDRQAADDMYDLLQEVWRGNRDLDVGVVVGGERDGY